MSITVNTKVFNADIPVNRDTVPYIGPNHTLGVLDLIELSRVAPQETKEYSGTARSKVRSVRTLGLTNAKTLTANASVETRMNMPVGASQADVEALLADHAAGLAQQWARDLAYKLDVQA